MKLFYKSITIVITPFLLFNCNNDDNSNGLINEKEEVSSTLLNTNFIEISSTVISNQGVPEISAYDKATKQIFSTNAEARKLEVIDISDITNPKLKTAIDISSFGGNLNSVAVKNGLVAIAIEGKNKTTSLGKIVVFKTDNLVTPYINTEAGFLPDMVTFSPDGKYILSANEGEPNDDNTIDPEGSITIVNVETKEVTNIGFEAFNNQEASLEMDGFRVFGETKGIKNTLSIDVEPEYIAISRDSKTAYIVLQENNGIAVLDIASKTITKIIPLGTKDFNSLDLDLSDKDEAFQLKKWNVKSFYQPDAIDYFSVNNVNYLITANEGDARDYDGFSEEERVSKIDLDPTAYPNAEELQKDENLGRLKVTIANGDTDDDGDIDQIFGYGGRSFSIWSTEGNLVYDSGNLLTEITNNLGTYADSRSDDKGSEPESVITYSTGSNVYAFLGLERTGDVLIFDITNVASPIFIKSVPNTSPEGLLFIPAQENHTNKDLLVVSNEFPDKKFVEDGNEVTELGKLVIYSN